jgi:phage FluMu protein Com
VRDRGYAEDVAEATRREDAFEVECPHCHRTFSGKLLSAESPRHAGFKCPHCRLFVAYERTAESDPE